ncbi:ABC transporter permease [Sporomusa termitida]|uniref:Glycine betaine transport system permease protein OpuAB n=1 Tax=Sporomusa termitida TaxID=2377 RepID=A0A517DR34_9FIRM|nr:ABC transporter permease subunit [Sporomusa termitida]QDR79832.1 Glycine betaine transport system permease protein OpuAB [Sporomusa termitida]
MEHLFTTFPEVLQFDIGTPINQAILYLSKNYGGVFDFIKAVLSGFTLSIQFVVELIPWWLTVIGVGVWGWRTNGRPARGLLFSCLLLSIGFLGLWQLMLETISLVIASVLISLCIGFPLGILVSGSDKANQAARPVLDAMQTMPTFVYLIPAVMFFGLGQVPAVIATTIYAVPPVIRLTSHAIRQVDAEVVEAARSFGSTWGQTLVKVQIPQALPTIMAGVNQTIMMAVAMVVTCAMIGAKGLGMEVLIGINRLEIGRGFTAGVAIVIVAIIIDRLTQGVSAVKKQ